MRIVHISDIHLTENGTEIWGINTLEHFQKAIHKIKEMDGLDGIIVNGLMNVLIELLKKSVCRLIVAQVITIT